MTNQEIVKICKKHGELTREKCFIRTEKRWGIVHKKDYSCRLCKKESSDKYRKRPEIKEKLIKKSKTDRIKFKERIFKTRKIYIEKNRKKLNETEKLRRHKNISHFRELIRNQQKKWRDNLDDNYVKSQLKSKYKIKQKDIPEWMIETKRVIIQLRRKIREIKNENN